MSDRHTDLPLFRWQPPKVEIIPFPCRARVGKIRQAAELVLASPTERASAARWRQMTDGIARQMERAGIPDETIQAELQIFTHAVNAEVIRRSRGQRTYNPEGGEIA
ncbi:DUF6074 family protein [Aureimonas sp. N4]|uniref:DUF6074 family protein n=1 Tax=Aureimonas sp. N4 TaxID=1638165 RepID=UPI000780F30F|nr:DUF6074 family protein [Aureimonas sp. N4]